ncbi:hypothetical protein WN51_13656 [Melipona quadrifasciata]|uniref:Uncharacterized protein n=1 Tax=Melipona quadrifasciata TaxID=166423 RepID=A0A0M9A0Y4_9HYME|nr:hypothetical protein WN51_13656 [Melipona quadrifasciata]
MAGGPESILRHRGRTLYTEWAHGTYTRPWKLHRPLVTGHSNVLLAVNLNARKTKKYETPGSNKRYDSTGNPIWPMFLEGFAYPTNPVSSSPASSMNASRNHRLTGNARGVSKHAGLRLTRHTSRDVSIGERESFGLHEGRSPITLIYRCRPPFFDDASSTALGMHTRRGLTP